MQRNSKSNIKFEIYCTPGTAAVHALDIQRVKGDQTRGSIYGAANEACVSDDDS